VTATDIETTTFELNGRGVSVRSDHPHLLAALREELDVTSPKDGCSPSGQCGCCTVIIDDKAVVACQTSLAKVAGKRVQTLEGVDETERARYAQAFAACGALQCGFCTPGIVMRAKSLLDRNKAGSRDDVARHLGAHLCRCTGYVKILDAIDLLASGAPLPDVDAGGGVGSSGVKYEAESLALGDRGYVDDIRVTGVLHGALRLADHARADVVRIDTSAARAVPGVEAVFTAADIPGELRVGIIHTDWPVLIPEGGRTSYLGDVLAVVVAEDRETARRAARLVDVEYRPLRPLTDAVAAIDDDEIAVWGTDGNVLSRSVYARGDVETALASSTHVVHDVFQTQRIEHAFLEPESTLAVPMDGGLHVYSGGQGVWDDRDQIASVLGVDQSRVTVELVSNGGAFGGKEDMSNQAQTALAAWLLQRAVKCTLSREESLLMHPKRHPIRMEYWAGCDADGKLTALKARMVGDSGAYASVGMKVLERAAGHASGPYHTPAIDVQAVAVRTNNPICGAFRGFGANQAQFAMEGIVDRLADAAGITGWEMRARNVITPGAVWGPGQVMDDGCAGARECLDRVKPLYDEARGAGKAVGLGLGLKNSGLGNGFKEIARAVVRFEPDGTIEVRHCWTEMGQGMHTVARQVAVEELGLTDPTRVRVVVDTTRELGAGQTTGSRGTLMGAGSIADACRKALADGCRTGVDYEGEWRVDWTNSLSEGVDEPVIHSAFGYAAQMVVMDRESGAIERVVAVHDVGRAVNPQLCAGQIEGSVHMGLGYALTEDFPSDPDGRPTNMTLRSLGIIRAKDVPPIDVVLVEAPQPRAPYGIKGVGEIGLVPTAGAVAAALHELDGEWRTSLPMRRS
jgi:xanthine dehydrogenase molybdenum-binding subunit